MRASHKEFDVTRMCQVLQVSRSGYYDWAGREESKRSQHDRVLLKEIRKIHQDTKEAYGATKTWRTLKQSGTVCGKHRVARLRRQAGIEARRNSSFDEHHKHSHCVSPREGACRRSRAIMLVWLLTNTDRASSPFASARMLLSTKPGLVGFWAEYRHAYAEPFLSHVSNAFPGQSHPEQE
jgi:hypothetical protein